MSSTPLLSIRGLYKAFDTQDALNGLDLDVYPGEFLTLLGPSGCGKTTTLRIIAGFEKPTHGSIYLNGEDITNYPPEKRAVNTVFQNYALFPHLNVEKNIAYGLKIRKTPKKEIAEQVERVLSLVQLEGYGKRMPSQLSGGQRQRVAIARSAILSPKLLLLDEPLGALDLQLRKQMQLELKRMQKALGIAFVYITHDQEEALSMSDRIALMRKGKFVQLDTPRNLYEHPKTAFAASFIGQTNLLDCRVIGTNEKEILLDLSGVNISMPSEDWVVPGEKLCLCVRAERMFFGPQAPVGTVSLPGTLMDCHYAGGEQSVIIKLLSGQIVTARCLTGQQDELMSGDPVRVWWNQNAVSLVYDDRNEMS